MAKTTHKTNTKDKHADAYFDRHWHLATDAQELAVTELEFALFRSYESFSRWQSECLATVSGQAMSSTDNAILHIVRMRRRAKGIKEIAMLFNRDDMPNLQYSIRKLTSAGLIEKEGDTPKGAKKGVRYSITEKGVSVTDAFAAVRKKVLIEFCENLSSDMPHASKLLEVMAGIYDQAARIAATHRGQTD